MSVMGNNCNTPDLLTPCTVVIFGASGDLTSRKLIPALYRMFISGNLPEPVNIIGCARTEYSRQQFIDRVAGSCQKSDTIDRKSWMQFSENLFYLPLDYSNHASYLELASRLAELDNERGTLGNIIFDLAVPPALYTIIVEYLGKTGLAQPPRDESWVRLVVEKPFGRNLNSAVALDKLLHSFFHEEQIFRIDHYLAKETVQNILSFRFGNQIFEPLWNRNHIDWVGILSAESLGVEGRAGYYDTSGVLRDMFQNHMMQLLALIGMEPPATFNEDAIRDEKVKLFKSIPPAGATDETIVLGQYGEGVLDSEGVIGYQDESGVREGSTTPTFALLEVSIDNWRWQGVPFYLVSGKRLKRKETRIVIQFKEAPLTLFQDLEGEHVSGNRLVLSIYPEESIRLSFQTKKPGPKICLQTKDLQFSYDGKSSAGLDAYE